MHVSIPVTYAALDAYVILQVSTRPRFLTVPSIRLLLEESTAGRSDTAVPRRCAACSTPAQGGRACRQVNQVTWDLQRCLAGADPQASGGFLPSPGRMDRTQRKEATISFSHPPPLCSISNRFIPPTYFGLHSNFLFCRVSPTSACFNQ